MLELHYNRPARTWNEALPIGNGNLGGMIFGGIDHETICLNEDTLWSGYPRPIDGSKAKKALSEIRRLLADKKYPEADLACHDLMGRYTESYLPIGNLEVSFHHGDVCGDYRRNLDISNAVARTGFRIGKVTHTRESFVSAPKGTLVLRMSADRPGMISFDATLDGKLRHETLVENRQFVLRGRSPSHIVPSYYDLDDPVRYEDGDACKTMRYEIRLAVLATGGETITDERGIHVSGADTALVFIVAGTTYLGHRSLPGTDILPVSKKLVERLSGAMKVPYGELVTAHVADYRKYFDRVELCLSGSKDEAMPTDQRIAKYGVTDPGLSELLFQYGRYLMISGSRPGTQPLNLQGIWSDKVRPQWSSNYTLNINAEMNYWPAETCNLGDLHMPFLEYMKSLSESGKITAAEYFGCRGWSSAHNSDIWVHTTPVGDFGMGDTVWAVWMMSAPWLCAHLWEHWLFSSDEAYLREHAWPIMKEAAAFILDWLVETPDGHLTTSPSTSPEHKFRTSDGTLCGASTGTTMDLTLIRELFDNCITASEILSGDEEFRKTLMEKRARLMPFGIGKHGQLREWSEDFEDEDVNHRHVSHLYGIYPGSLLHADSESKFLAAGKKSLERRGDDGTGWSLGWKVCL